MTIGDVLKAARLKRKLSADELATSCGVSRSVIYKWEKSEFILPKNFKMLSKALGLSIKKLEAANGIDERKAGSFDWLRDTEEGQETMRWLDNKRY